MKEKLLIIEDEASLAKQLKWGVSDEYDVIIAHTPKKACQLLEGGAFPVVTLDLGLPPSPDSPEEGFRLLEAMPELSPHSKVIVITGNAEQENAMKAISLGAVDFCPKPIELDLLRVILRRTFRIYNLEQANRAHRKPENEHFVFQGMVGASSAMKDLFGLIRQISDSGYPVLIQGESGTGKEMVAQAIHKLSSRRQGPLVAINCSAIPETLLESELFGYEKGAFTGANARKIGKFEQAESGTIFLDEIGDMPHNLQAKLLRFLQEHTIERVGGAKTISLDVRLLAATHVDLETAVKEGRFREDLYYRLNVVPMVVPPLRDRQEDILLLARHFIDQEVRKSARGKTSLSRAAAAAMTRYEWPGNVRELQNCVYRSLAVCKGDAITPVDLGLVDAEMDAPVKLMSLKEVREEAEKQAIRRALAATGNNISHAAKLLGVSRPTLHDLIKKLGIESVALISDPG